VSYRAKLAPYGYAAGLEGVVTSWACDEQAHDADWRERFRTALGGSAIAAVVGAGAAGALGGFVKRPILGALVGAAAGWTIHAVVTAPFTLDS